MEDLLNPIGPKSKIGTVIESAKVNPETQKENTAEENWGEGVIDIDLPSLGLFYFPPYNKIDKLHVRSLDYRDEDILTTKKFVDDGTVYDKIVTNVIQDKGMTAQNLVPVDRDTILLWLRSTSLGNIMDVNYNCKKCDTENIASWDLTKIEIPKYSEEIRKELEEHGEITITTPLAGLKIKIKVPTIGESNDTQKRLTRKKELEKTDKDFLGTGTLNLLVSGVEVGDKTIRNKNEITNYFNEIRLPITDARYIRKKAAELNLSYDTAQTLICKNCDHIQEGVELPIVHPNFLWPDV